jgi:hypothetical protein
MKKLLRWLTMHKKRDYTVEFTARGFMGNEYCAGTYDVTASDYQLKHCYAKPVTVSNCVFAENFNELSAVFPANKKGIHPFISRAVEW